MQNVMTKPSNIMLGYNPLTDAFYARIKGPVSCDITLGDARTAVGFLKANDVRHFDMDHYVADTRSLYTALCSAARDLKFEM